MKSRRKFTPEFKAKVALAAIKEQKTIAILAQEFDLSPTQINTWKREFLNNASSLFKKNSDRKEATDSLEKEKETLYSKIGQLQVEVDFLKKALS
ncbi:transposase [Aureibacter tunicatorum]|uniref:Transposase n=3 Tax=Aureibacter tunicatorum TaxID=866807 RepID=A0AAE3XUC5_9BACT|nr:transposase [Aureibacter tunicatorum]BDD03615.1 hypothetical protein AUTU_10980 [Aureibacter tunicatorum]BDD03983.1 hypothetical protein AUTU_14660 [Aureibacter tunicatorum]BDD04575.1 hypothetical protein AUTU_20580 [Aureibacter tunicatorum]BDD07115.1 hypothetical protein AUTU_45980 [Aureibacter tunicatorum]